MGTRFTVCGKVCGKARPRVTRYGTYTPKASRDYEAAIGLAYIEAGGKILEGAIEVTIEVFRSLPKNRPKKIVSEPDTFKPDLDNIIKAVLDGLNCIAWKDDNQVTRINAFKHPRERCKERIEVSVSRIGD